MKGCDERAPRRVRDALTDMLAVMPRPGRHGADCDRPLLALGRALDALCAVQHVRGTPCAHDAREGRLLLDVADAAKALDDAEKAVRALPAVAEVVTDKRELPDLFDRMGFTDLPTGISAFGSAWATITAPALPKFSLPPVWSKCQWVLTTNLIGLGVIAAIAVNRFSMFENSAASPAPRLSTACTRRAKNTRGTTGYGFATMATSSAIRSGVGRQAA